MSAVDTGEIKKAFSGDRGKVLVLVGVVGAGYIWWTRSRTPSIPQPVPDDGLHSPGSGSAPGGSSGQTPIPGDPAPSDGRPTTNAAWLDKAVKILSNPPWNYSDTGVWNAIMKAFQGQPISAMEENWIRAAMSALGSPPEGMPPLNISAPIPSQPSTRVVHVKEGQSVESLGVPMATLQQLNSPFQWTRVTEANEHGYLSPTNPRNGNEKYVFPYAQDINVPA